MSKKHTSFTLSQEALDLLESLSKHLGIKKTAVIELIIREKSRSENVTRTAINQSINQQVR